MAMVLWEVNDAQPNPPAERRRGKRSWLGGKRKQEAVCHEGDLDTLVFRGFELAITAIIKKLRVLYYRNR